MDMFENDNRGPGARYSGNVVGMRFRPERNEPVPPRAHSRPNVLIVEDSAATADTTGLLLRAAGARVRWADCLQSAERHLRGFAPETVIVDPGLPDGSGLELVRRLVLLGRARPRVVVISGDDSLYTAAMNAGADQFLAKPVPAAVLLREIVVDPTGLKPEISGAQPAAPSLLADLQRARLQVLRAALSGKAQEMDYPVQFLTSLARSGELVELSRLLDRLSNGLDGPRELAAGLARLIDVQAARGVSVRA